MSVGVRGCTRDVSDLGLHVRGLACEWCEWCESGVSRVGDGRRARSVLAGGHILVSMEC